MESKKKKFRQTLLDMADSGAFIPGIYNYCDRWCERCTHSHKCLTYSHEQKMKEECNDPETDLIDNEKFWEQINLSFEVTLDMILEDARRCGINIGEFPDTEEPEIIETPVEILANEYSFAMDQWLKENCEILNNKSNQLLNTYTKIEPALSFADALEVVQWYCYFISAKIHRSFYEFDSRQQAEDNDFDLTYDNTGSAKIAIIAINRSLEALTILYHEMKNWEDEILKFMRQLSNIKKQMLASFPSAMQFKRPGFDD